jgi:cell division protein FtsI (penicillin-binding protein 3)
MSQVTAPQRTAISSWRINILLLIVLLGSFVIARQLVTIQVFGEHRGRQLDELAQNELNKHVVLQPRRGTIFDRNGVALAMNVDKPSLYVDPTQINDEGKLAMLLEPILNVDAADLLRIFEDKERAWVRLERWLEPDKAEQVRAIGERDQLPRGLYLIPEAKREYPQGSFAASVVGVANHEGEGIAGAEAFYNKAIRGITGTLRAEQSADARPILIAPQQVVEPQDGADIKLTIDSSVQKLVEDELQRAVQEHQAEGGSILVMDPNTGEMLGMATWPPFDPNRYLEYPPEQINHNNAITDVYEPGSTFKVIMAAIGLQSGAFTPKTTVQDDGFIARYGHSIVNWNYAANGRLTPGMMLYHSSNVASLQFAEMIGRDTFYKYVRLFGFGQPTHIDLGGEAIGIVPWPENNPDTWSDLTLDTNSFGQGIAVTPVQLLTAYAAIANGGLLVWPHVVKEQCKGTQCTPVQPRIIRRVLDQATTDALRSMLTKNAERYAGGVWGPYVGSYAEQPLVPGYRVTAKTGTSQVVSTAGYEDEEVISSIIGWAPSEQPRVAVLVKIDRPADFSWEHPVTSPVYQRVVTQLMEHLRIPPDPSYIAPGQTIGGPEPEDLDKAEKDASNN